MKSEKKKGVRIYIRDRVVLGCRRPVLRSLASVGGPLLSG